MPRDRTTQRGRARRWLHTGYGWDIGVPHPPSYSWADAHLSDALNEDPEWRAWWRRARRRELWLLPLFTPHPEAEPRVRRRLLDVEVVLDVDSAPFHAEDRQALADLAVEHVRRLVGLAAERLRLGPTPPWPALPAVPEDLSEYEFVDETPSRDEMRELLQEIGADNVDEILEGFSYGPDGRPSDGR